MPELKKEQKQAVFHDQGNILVSASAGSGKTFVMIKRAIRLIVEGKASVKELLAVTFTELAAKEMKEKLKDALVEQIEKTRDERLVRELGEVSTADICTLHSFCGRLIRNFFFKAGVSPDFKILDEDQANVLKNQSIDKTFKYFYEQGEPWFRKICSRHASDRSDKEFKEMLLKMREQCFVNADTDLYRKMALEYYSESGFNALKEGYTKQVMNNLQKLVSVGKDALYVFQKYGAENQINFTNAILEDIEQIISSNDVYTFKLFENYKRDLPKGGKRTEEMNVAKEDIKWIREEFCSLESTINTGFSNREQDLADLQGLKEHTESLFKILDKFNEYYKTAKTEENGLDFSDLEHCALDILSDQEICQTVKERYKYIFVDEYQDVNQVQEQLITSITNDNLFMVGDAKQSIYGFRGCRPTFFMDKHKKMEQAKEATVLLNCNFRSANAVLDTVNQIFSYSMTEEYYGASYKKQSMLVGGGSFKEEYPGRTSLHLLKTKSREHKPLETPRIYNVLEELERYKKRDVASIAKLITNIITEECSLEYYDAKEEKMRPIKYGDIAILTRNKENKYVRNIVGGLASFGIPVVSVVKENVCDFPEIKVLVSALELIDCFSQDIPLASTLKSQIGGFTEEDLAKIVIFHNDNNGEGGFTNAFNNYLENAEGELKDRLVSFKEYFDKVRLLADFVGAHGILKRIVNDKNLEQYLYSEEFGRTKVKRMNRFISASMVNGKPLSVKEFLSRISNAPDSFGLSDLSDENAVKVMTIHASKGLEFPVVIVCGLERSTNTREERDDIMFDYDMGFAVKNYNDKARTVRETPLRAMFRKRMKENRLKEELRLFYVALTRASYSLHMTFESGEDKRVNVFKGAKRFLDYVPKEIPIVEHDPEEFVVTAKANELRTVLVGSPDQELVEQIKQNLSFRYKHVSDTELALKLSVTKAVQNKREEEYPTLQSFDEQEEVITGLTKEECIERGIIAHKILELFDFSRISEFETQIAKMIEKGSLSKEQVAKIDLERLKNALDCTAFTELGDKKLYREKDFIVSIEADKVFETSSKEQVLLQGIIDLLAVNDEQAVIIDYKYSRLDKDSLKVKYAKQLDLYAYALEKATGIKVKTKALINIFRGESVIID